MALGGFMINIGERIKFIRETYDLSQQDLANLFHVTKSSISHYEKNDWFIPLKHLSTMSNYLNLSMDYILDFTKIKRYPNMNKEINLKRIGERIKEICIDQNLSNVKLAKELNTSESNIRNYKAGKYLILTPFVVQLSLKYNYSTDWIVGKSDTKYIYKEKISI